MKKVYASLLIVFIYINAGAQIVAWDFNGNNGNENDVFASTVNPGLNTPKISRGNVTAESLPNSFNAKSWLASGSYTAAIANGAFCQFSIEPKPGYHLSISSVTASFRRNADGPRTFQWRYSLDGTNFTDFGPKIFYNAASTNGVLQAAIDVTAIDPLYNVPNNKIVTIRLYGYNAISTTGNFAFGRLAGDDISVDGTVEATLLPIKLVSFSAVNNKAVTRLNWVVDCTSNSATFELQRSTDTRNFSSLNTQTASQVRCTMPFDYTDNHTPESSSFYRLKMIDVDGHFAYSNIIQINHKDANSTSVNVYPTVVTDHATLTVSAVKANDAIVIYYDNSGKAIKQQKVAIAKGNNNFSLDVSSLIPGAYRVKVVQADGNSGNASIIKK